MHNTPCPSHSSDSEDDFAPSRPLPSLDTLLAGRLSGFSDEPAAPSTPRQSTQELEPPSSRPFESSPILEKDPVKRAEHRRRKGRKKADITLRRKREDAHSATILGHKQKMEDALKVLEEKHIRFGDLLAYVFDPTNGQGHIHWHEFFVIPGRAAQILDWWSSSEYSTSARNQVKDWATAFVRRIVAKEACKVTKEGVLQTLGQKIDGEFVSSFSFSRIHNTLAANGMAPVSISILEALCTSRHADKHTTRRQERTKMVCD